MDTWHISRDHAAAVIIIIIIIIIIIVIVVVVVVDCSKIPVIWYPIIQKSW